MPRQARTEARPTELVLADLAAISALAAELGVRGDVADHDTGLSTDDVMP